MCNGCTNGLIVTVFLDPGYLNHTEFQATTINKRIQTLSAYKSTRMHDVSDWHFIMLQFEDDEDAFRQYKTTADCIQYLAHVLDFCNASICKLACSEMQVRASTSEFAGFCMPLPCEVRQSHASVRKAHGSKY